ncbi:GH92 family glycosyl hydrolase [Marinilabiliaceae bacterium ANBcel2]|nr:GH92 family glycosyl hydrolase [Marinilabiliaceae bacterium ANBcel2]
MKKCTVLLLFVIVALTSCRSTSELAFYVDPIIGTDEHGHTFPGATYPFGMVQLSPDTGIEGWDWCSGYHYSDSSIIGFSHTHLSGTGGADLGDIMVMPFTGEHKWESGTKEDPDKGYRSRFSHDRESASAGIYSVYLDDYEIGVDLTVSPRAGIHRYRFNNDEKRSVIVDLKHGISNQTRESYIKVTADNEIVGLRRSQGWAADQFVYFVMQFSSDFSDYKLMQDGEILAAGEKAEGVNVKIIMDFDSIDEDELIVKTAISAVDEEGARVNFENDASHWDFDRYYSDTRSKWNDYLGKITIDGATNAQKRTFYTAMYHAHIAPYLFTDADGRYRGMDKKIHNIDGHNMYTLFSLWDTFRATHPLWTLTAPHYNSEFINTMLTQYKQNGLLPVWELMGNETGTMIGYHSVPVIWDAYQKGDRSFDAELAFEAMLTSAMEDHIGLDDYKNIGFIPFDREGNSVSKTVEYAFDDWCIAQMAKEMGDMDKYEEFLYRSQNYRNVFDTSVGFLRGRKANGSWREPFDPLESSILGSGDFTEGNSWHYTFFAPHDNAGLMELHGGDDAMADKIDEMFNEEPVVTNPNAHDISGLIGQYAQGNEPSHHVAYLYNYTGNAWRTQEMVSLIVDSLYTDQPDGISGNEDCGQLSAWYIFSVTGFYPVAPGSGHYVIGSPRFEKTTIHLDNEKEFVVKANGRTDDALYIQSATLNGEEFLRSYIKHEEIVAGGELVFEMGKTPNKDWGRAEEHRPYTGIPEEYRLDPIEERLVFVPYINDDRDLFSEEKRVEILCNTPDVSIHYTTDGSKPDQNSSIYTGELTFNETTHLKARAFKEGMVPSEVMSREFIRAHYHSGDDNYPAIEYISGPSRPYAEPGELTLIDGYKGTLDFHDGNWLGFNSNLEAVIDFGEVTDVEIVRLSFMQNVGSWILLPKEIRVSISNDNETYSVVGTHTNDSQEGQTDVDIVEYIFDVNDSFRYAKIEAISKPVLPNWHQGAGNRPWIFSDEIIFEF